MTFDTKADGEVLSAANFNKAGYDFDSVADATARTSANGAVDEEYVTFSGVKVTSAAGSVRGLWIDCEVRKTAATQASFSIKITGSGFGSVWLRSPDTAVTDADTLVDAVTTAFLTTISSFRQRRIYFPIPAGIITGDATYDIRLGYTNTDGGGAAVMKNVTVRLESEDRLAAELS